MSVDCKWRKVEAILRRAACFSFLLFWCVEFTSEIMSISNKTPCIFDARRRQLGGRGHSGQFISLCSFLIEKDTLQFVDKKF